MNATFEESMLNDCLVQLQEQFPEYSELDQMKILESIRSLVVEPKTITKARPLEDVLADIREAIEDGGRARTFFTNRFF